MRVRMKHEQDSPIAWFGHGTVLQDEGPWILVEWPTSAGVQWTPAHMLIIDKGK